MINWLCTARDLFLTQANSVNTMRVMPQSTASGRVHGKSESTLGGPVVFEMVSDYALESWSASLVLHQHCNSFRNQRVASKPSDRDPMYVLARGRVCSRLRPARVQCRHLCEQVCLTSPPVQTVRTLDGNSCLFFSGNMHYQQCAHGTS